MKELKPCNPEIFENGTPVCVIGNKSAQWIEKFVRELRKDTGEQADWSFIAGRGVIRALGDVDKVRERVRYFSANFLVVVEKDGVWTHK